MLTNGMTTIVSNLHSAKLLPSLTVFGCSLTAIEIETGPIYEVVSPYFLWPSSFSFPWYCALYDIFADHMSEPS